VGFGAAAEADAAFDGRMVIDRMTWAFMPSRAPAKNAPATTWIAQRPARCHAGRSVHST